MDDGSAFAILKRGVASALDSGRDADPARRSDRDDISAAVDLIRQTLMGDVAERPRVPDERLSRAVEHLRRTYVRELARLPEDRIRLRDVLRVLETIDRVAEALEPLPGSERPAAAPQADPLLSISTLAHDMRSPLTSILFLLETLRNGNGETLSQMQQRQLALVYSAAFGLNSMVDDVLMLNRASSFRNPPAVAFSVSEIMLSVRHIVQPIAEEKQLAITLRYPDIDARIGQPVALSRVLLNLVTNALKYTHEGTVTVSAQEITGTRVKFVVQDTGPGVPPNVMAALSSARHGPARQGSGSAHGAFSAGLGLTICTHLVRSMGSELHAESAPGQGTSFWFELEAPPEPRQDTRASD